MTSNLEKITIGDFENHFRDETLINFYISIISSYRVFFCLRVRWIVSTLHL